MNKLKSIEQIKKELLSRGESFFSKKASICELYCAISEKDFFEVLDDGESTGIVSTNINDIEKMIIEYKNSSY